MLKQFKCKGLLPRHFSGGPQPAEMFLATVGLRGSSGSLLQKRFAILTGGKCRNQMIRNVQKERWGAARSGGLGFWVLGAEKVSMRAKWRIVAWVSGDGWASGEQWEPSAKAFCHSDRRELPK